MAWSGDGITIPVRFRIISGSSSTASQGRSNNPFTGMKLPNEVIALGVTRTARPVTDNSTAANTSNSNNARESTGQNTEQTSTAPPVAGVLNLAPSTDANTGVNTSATTSNAQNTEDNSGNGTQTASSPTTATSAPQEPTP